MTVHSPVSPSSAKKQTTAPPSERLSACVQCSAAGSFASCARYRLTRTARRVRIPNRIRNASGTSVGGKRGICGVAQGDGLSVHHRRNLRRSLHRVRRRAGEDQIIIRPRGKRERLGHLQRNPVLSAHSHGHAFDLHGTVGRIAQSPARLDLKAFLLHVHTRRGDRDPAPARKAPPAPESATAPSEARKNSVTAENSTSRTSCKTVLFLRLIGCFILHSLSSGPPPLRHRPRGFPMRHPPAANRRAFRHQCSPHGQKYPPPLRD